MHRDYVAAQDRRALLKHMADVWADGLENGRHVAMGLGVEPEAAEAAFKAHPPVNPYEQPEFEGEDEGAGA